MSDRSVTSMSTLYNVALVAVDNLPNDLTVLSSILSRIAEENINIDMISQSPPYKGKTNISFSMPADSIVRIIELLNGFKATFPHLHAGIDSNSMKISVFGEGMKETPGVAAKLFRLLAENEIEVKLVTTSEVDISFLIYDKDADKAITALSKEFNVIPE